MNAVVSAEVPPGGLKSVLDGFRALGPAKLAAMGLVSLGMLCMLVLLTLRGGEADSHLALLYGDLDIHEAGQMADILDKAHIPHELSGESDQIMVPVSQVAAARLLLAKSSLPSGGSTGYEIFDHGDSLTTTQFQQDINRTRALEGELVRSIRLIEGVRGARVHLVLPHREPFAAEQQTAQASVLLTMRGAGRLDPEAVQAILNLVAAAVPGLKAQAIAIIDNRGDVLARAGAPVGGVGVANTAEEMRQAMELRLSHQVEEMLDASLGPDKVRAEASVTLDLDQINETDESYNPDQQVLRSEQTTSDKSRTTEAEQNTSVQNNLPNADAGKTPAGTQDERKEETNNYEIGKKVRTLVQSAPRVQRISLAVMVDGETGPGKNGHLTWRPRSDAELAQITALVKSAIGFDAKRGDAVTVETMPFTKPDDDVSTPAPREIFGLERDDAVHLAQTGMLGIVALIIALFVFRPMIKRLVPTGATSRPSLAPPLSMVADASGAGSPATANPELRRLAGPSGGSTLQAEHLDGQINASSVRRLVSLVEQYPQESLSIVRGWLAEGES